MLEESTGRQYRFGMPGPRFQEHEWEQFLTALSNVDPAPDYLVASGSLPPGVQPDFYARVARVGKERGAKVIIDVSGEALEAAIQERTIAIAKGEYKPRKGEPKVWFESMESLGQILSGQNQKLLRLIKDSHPASLTELETMAGRKKSNLSRTLKTLSNYGIVDLVREKGAVRPVVNATDFHVELSI